MEDLIKVKNRSNGKVYYELKDKNLLRVFETMEIKKIPKDELKSLSYIQGGRKLLKDYLQVITDDKSFLAELIGYDIEPEYNYSKEDAVKVMLEGTLEEFLDMLDFAPTAIVEIVKSEAVNLNLNDVSKRRAIKDKTGFDVDKAIELTKPDKEEVKTQTSTAKERRVPVKEEKEKPVSKYEIIE